MKNKIKYIDLFCGLGGLRTGLTNSLIHNNIESICLLSSDIKKHAISTYEKNYNEKVFGDIKTLDTKDLIFFDILLAGFPCQAFSSAGLRKGFEDTRGTLFFEVARILKDIKPTAFILENVEGLVNHDKGNTLKVILNTLKEIGYSTTYKVLNSSDFSSPQNRKRIYIVGIHGNYNNQIMDEIFNFDKIYPKLLFKDIREYDLPVTQSKLNIILNNHFTDLNFLQGKSINDKRGGDNNIHSWDLSLKGKIPDKQKELINLIVTKRRYKKWAIENNTAWFDGIPLSLEQIKTFIDYPNLKTDLDLLTKLGYLRLEHPKDYNNQKEKVSRTDLPLGYTLTTGKLSFEFTQILDDNAFVPTIVATDASKIGVLEKEGLRQLSTKELKRLFGFPDTYITEHLNEREIFDLFGNSVSVNVVQAISDNLLSLLKTIK